MRASSAGGIITGALALAPAYPLAAAFPLLAANGGDVGQLFE